MFSTVAKLKEHRETHNTVDQVVPEEENSEVIDDFLPDAVDNINSEAVPNNELIDFNNPMELENIRACELEFNLTLSS